MDLDDNLFVGLIICVIAMAALSAYPFIPAYTLLPQPSSVEPHETPDVSPEREWMSVQKTANQRDFLRRIIVYGGFSRPYNCDQCAPARYFNWPYSCRIEHKRDDIVITPGHTAKLIPQFDYGTYEALMLARPLSSKLTQGQRIAMTTTIAQNATWRTFANLSLVDRRKSVSISIEDVRMGWAVERRRGASVFEYNHQNPEGLHFLI
jgi:hypothetical protein